jgi:hypothetical protein
MFNNIIDEVKEPLIGLTYVVEILNREFKESRYKCVLCDKLCQRSGIISHLIGKSHRLEYLNKHFPTVMSRLNSITRFSETKVQLQTILHEVAQKVETKFGRVMAEIYRGTQYREVRRMLEADVKRKNHGSEQDIPNCVQYLIGEYLMAREPPLPPTFTDVSGDNIKERLNDFRADVYYETNRIENELMKYQHDPETHPFYKREWQLFWKRKQDEAVERGQDLGEF